MSRNSLPCDYISCNAPAKKVVGGKFLCDTHSREYRKFLEEMFGEHEDAKANPRR